MSSAEEKKALNTAILVFAHYLGIDLDSEDDLLFIAEEAFENLPAGWEFGISEGEVEGIPYFFNAVTKESDWKHPEETIYMKRVARERELKDQKSKGDKQGRGGAGGGAGRGREGGGGIARGNSRDPRTAPKTLNMTTLLKFRTLLTTKMTRLTAPVVQSRQKSYRIKQHQPPDRPGLVLATMTS